MAKRIYKAGATDSVVKGDSLWFVQNGLLTACTSDDFVVYVEHLSIDQSLEGDYVIDRPSLKRLIEGFDRRENLTESLSGDQGFVKLDMEESDLAYLYETVQAACSDGVLERTRNTPTARLAINPSRLRKVASLAHPDYPLDLTWSLDLEFDHVMVFKAGPNAYGVIVPLDRDKQDERGLFS